MRRAHFPWMTIAVSLLAASCADDSPGPSGDGDQGGAPQGGSNAGGRGGGGANGGAPQGGASEGGGGAAACESFGDPCTTCGARSCEDPYCFCLGDPDCFAIWQCAIDCDGEEECLDGCEVESGAGYSDFLRVVDCLGTECSASCGGLMPLAPCADCWVASCEDELDACVLDTSCNEMLDCYSGCPDATCGDACYEAAPDTTAADALFACTDTSCDDECAAPTCQGFGDPCTDCAFASEECNALYCGCFADPACSAYAQCTDGCNMDAACQDGCELESSSGYSAFYAMADCMGTSCEEGCGFGPLPNCFVCLVTSCATQTNTCQGDAECNEFLDCISVCGGDQGCNGACYLALTDTTEADAFIACAQGPCDGACSDSTMMSASSGGMSSGSVSSGSSGPGSVTIGSGFVTVGP